MTTKKIVAVKKDNGGDLSEFKLDNGDIINLEQCVNYIQIGELNGYNVGKDRLGRDTVRSNPDGDPTNNLSNLPNF